MARRPWADESPDARDTLWNIPSGDDAPESDAATAGQTECEINDLLGDVENLAGPLHHSRPNAFNAEEDSEPGEPRTLPRLRPQRSRRPPSRMFLPPSTDLAEVDQSAIYTFSARPEAQVAQGPSARLWWAIFLTWCHRWGHRSGMSPPLVNLIGIYVRACLFQEESIMFVAQLQWFLALVLPWYALAPSWLWWMLFGRYF